MRQFIKKLALGILFLQSCTTTEVEGIQLGHNLYDTRGYMNNQQLVGLIRQTLKKDTKSLSQLIEFHCGGAAGCYDLGDVVTQIIFKMGEDDFIKMTLPLSPDQKNQLKGLIGVGLEYGHRRAGESHEIQMDRAFPKLNVILN